MRFVRSPVLPAHMAPTKAQIEKAAALKAADAAAKAAAKAQSKAPGAGPADSSASSGSVKRPGDGDGGVIPAKKPCPEQEGGGVGPGASAGQGGGDAGPTKPVIPADPNAVTDVRGLLATLIPHVRYHLQAAVRDGGALFGSLADVPPWQHQPLEISESQRAISSFKAPWTKTQARASVDSTRMYEAGGNVMWCRALPQSAEHKVLAGEAPSWAEIDDLAGTAFSLAPLQGAVAHGGRLVFPVPLTVFGTLDVVDRDAFDGTLDVLSGHAYIYGWYLAMHRSLEAGPSGLAHVAKLMEAALTITLHLRVGLATPALAALSISISELYKASERLMADSFAAFADKALCLCAGEPNVAKMTALQKHAVRFNGAAVSKTMMLAIQLFDRKINLDARAALRMIDRIGGRDVFSTGYTKLSKACSACVKEAHDDGSGEDSVSAMIAYFLQWVAWALKFEVVGPKDIDREGLDRSRDGLPGYVQVVLGRRAIVGYVQNLVDDLRAVVVAKPIAEEMDNALRAFRSYTRYEAAFPPASGGSEGGDALASPQGNRRAKADGEDDDGAMEAASGTMEKTDAVQVYCSKFKNKVCQLACDFFYDLLAGNHDEAIRTSLKGDATKKAIDVKWCDGDSMPELQEIVRHLNLHKNVIGAGQDGPPGASSRTLKRYSSAADDEGLGGGREEEIKKERHDTWRQAQASSSARAVDRVIVYLGNSLAITW